MYSRQELQNANSQYLQDYLSQPILPIADLKPLCDRLCALTVNGNVKMTH